MEQVFKHNTLKETSRSNHLACTSQKTHKSSRGKERKGALIMVQNHEVTTFLRKCKAYMKKGHAKEDYWKLHTKKHTNHFEKRKKKKVLIIVDLKERVDSTSNFEGKITCYTERNYHGLVAVKRKGSE